MNEILETVGKYRVRLETDTDPQSPRTSQDNLCHVVTLPNRDYIDVDDDGGPLQQGWDRIKNRSDAVAVFTRWARIFYGAVVEYHTPHNGAYSLWYLTAEQFSEIPDPVACIKAEIEEYQNWAEGEVYGFIIEEAVTWTSMDDSAQQMSTWEEVVSCWGYGGYDYAKTAALEEFTAYKDESKSPGDETGPGSLSASLRAEIVAHLSRPGSENRAGELLWNEAVLLPSLPGNAVVFRWSSDAKRQEFLGTGADPQLEAAITAVLGQRPGWRHTAPEDTEPPKLIMDAGEMRDIYAHMRRDETFPMRLTDGTMIHVRAGNPVTGEIGNRYADMDEFRVVGEGL